MKICCFDLEGVLVPEVWLAVADHYRLEALRLTTRDISNLDQLMQHRIKVLKAEKIKMKDILNVISKMKPLPGAKSFLKKVQAKYPTVILSDTFYEFIGPLMKQLDFPTVFCNSLQISKTDYMVGYTFRQKDGKRKAVKSFQKVGFEVAAVGDSYNDLTMLQTAETGIFFNPPQKIREDYPNLPVAWDYAKLLKLLKV